MPALARDTAERVESGTQIEQRKTELVTNEVQ
ncbi:hypothetical protein Desaf_1471 [Desulfocurvibacter africanus subsp. africanus str. Walvis Bay]|uniref:Uncharacterized protein n=1 Tax=Desulfocurvibacter africanus subsp. africanus str. Walvis Bay TaxID=690850 RepID=F3Z0A6_DESAF|nr:hypothetical protein Desaf_1471 [Desulfocurvibacter africanus subsp. africanus str. Walvis Bay]